MRCAVPAASIVLILSLCPVPSEATGGRFRWAWTERAAPDLGPEEFVQAGGADLSVPGYSVPVLADWNEDGLADLVVGEGGGGYTGKVRVYLNIGSAHAPVFDGHVFAQADGSDLEVPPSGCLGAFPRVVDWDGDARKDLLVGQADGTIRLFLNTATDQSPAFDGGRLVQVGDPTAKFDIDVGSRATPAVADWDNDGRKDLVVGAYDGYIRIYLNEGLDADPDFRSELLAQASGSPLFVAALRTSPVVDDVTNDGRKDLVVGATDGRILLFENTGTDAAPVFQGPVQITSDGQAIDLPSTRSRPSLGAWRGNGAKDLLVGSSDGTVRLFRDLDTVFANDFESADLSAWSASVP